MLTIKYYRLKRTKKESQKESTTFASLIKLSVCLRILSQTSIKIINSQEITSIAESHPTAVGSLPPQTAAIAEINVTGFKIGIFA